jgi:hypothetical protein
MILILVSCLKGVERRYLASRVMERACLDDVILAGHRENRSLWLLPIEAPLDLLAVEQPRPRA